MRLSVRFRGSHPKPGGARVTGVRRFTMTRFSSIAKVCSLLALIMGVFSAVLASISVVLFFRLGGGRECYLDLNVFLNWHAVMTVLVLPFAIAAAFCGRVRIGVLASGLCFGAWLVTTALVANCFHGDRPPPSWKTSQTPNPLAGVGAGRTTEIIEMNRVGLSHKAGALWLCNR